MLNNVNMLFDCFKGYYSDYIYLSLSLIAVVYLFVSKKKSYRIIIYACFLLFIIIFNPITYGFLHKEMSYWRFFWAIPCSVLVILALVELISTCKGMWYKFLFFACATLIISVIGTSVFKYASIGKKTNPYGLTDATVDIGSTMLDLDDSPRCILPRGLISSIRLYSGDIEPMYGRDAEGYILYASDEVKAMYTVMESEAPDYNYVLSRAVHWGYNFVVNVESKPIDEKLLSKYGYTLLKNEDGYNIYFNPNITDDSLEGYLWRYNDIGWWLEDEKGNSLSQKIVTVYGISYYINSYGYALESIDDSTAKTISEDDIIITQFGKDNYDKPSMFYTLDDQKGHFVIVDGGNSDEYEDVLRQIRLYGGVVDAWILTHPHDDHIGAFNEILKNYSDEIDVKKIYAIDIDSDYYHKVANEWDAIEYYDQFEEIVSDNDLLNNSILEYVEEGNTYSIGDLSFKVYNTFTKDSYSISTGSLPNATSMVFEVFGKNESMLFLGDLEQESANSILKKYGNELHATYVQAAHHGQNLDESFYDNIEFNTVTVDAPDWLRQEDKENDHTAYRNIEFFDNNNILVLSYDSSPNVILIH